MLSFKAKYNPCNTIELTVLALRLNRDNSPGSWRKHKFFGASKLLHTTLSMILKFTIICANLFFDHICRYWTNDRTLVLGIIWSESHNDQILPLFIPWRIVECVAVVISWSPGSHSQAETTLMKCYVISIVNIMMRIINKISIINTVIKLNSMAAWLQAW